jgi:hypothetical protein
MCLGMANGGKSAEMKDKEIIKALETCILGDCEVCTCRCGSVGDCRDTLNKHSLDLINRQQAAIDMLNAESTLAISERNAFQKSFYAIVKENRQLKADLKEIGVEYERLDDTVANGVEVCHECHEKYDKKIKQTKAEAIKEFAKKIDDEIYEALTNNENVIREREIKYNVNRFDDIFCSSCMGKNTALCGIHDFITELVKEKVGADNG